MNIKPTLNEASKLRYVIQIKLKTHLSQISAFGVLRDHKLVTKLSSSGQRCFNFIVKISHHSSSSSI